MIRLLQNLIYGSVMRVTASEKKEQENVAVIKGGYLGNRVKSEYPELKQIDYDTAEECMDAVLNGHAGRIDQNLP